jgi:hypothetical protein
VETCRNKWKQVQIIGNKYKYLETGIINWKQVSARPHRHCTRKKNKKVTQRKEESHTDVV